MATLNELLDRFDTAHTAFRSWSDIHLDYTNRDQVILMARVETVRTNAHSALTCHDPQGFHHFASEAVKAGTGARNAANPVPYGTACVALSYMDTFIDLVEEAAAHNLGGTADPGPCRYCRGGAYAQHGFCTGLNDTGTGPCPCSANNHDTQEAHHG